MHLKTSNTVARRTARTRPITVRFPVSKRAISKLRSLAIEKDPRLVELGVLAVQISEDENIVLGIDLERNQRKSQNIANNNSHHTNPSTNRNIPGFQTLSKNLQSPRNFYGTQVGTTTVPRNYETFGTVRKSLETSTNRRKAKEVVNAARRGARGRGRAGKLSLKMPPRSNSWNIAYNKLPGDQWRRHANPPHFEPTVASQACGIANVPLAQTTLLKDNTHRKRDVAANSPRKSPMNTGIHSDDESSISSSSSSQSPMNEEELINLFVDQNYSATSILKQLAESRSKQDEKNLKGESGQEINTEQNDGLKPETPGSVVTPVLQHSGINEASSNKMQLLTDNESPASNNILLKRNIKESKNTAVPWSNLLQSQAKRQKTCLADTCATTKIHDQQLLNRTNAPDKAMHLQNGKSIADNSQPIAKSLQQNEALRNYTQYGYYYTANELKALGKTLNNRLTSSRSSRNESSQQPIQSHVPGNVVNPPHIDAFQESSTTPVSAALATTESQKTDNHSEPITSISQNGSKIQPESHQPCDKAKTNNECTGDQLKPAINSPVASEPAPSKELNSEKEVSCSVSCASSAIATTNSISTANDTTAMNLRKPGTQCYALSYVYPMGTVWYPYVAITPYAVLGDNQKKESDAKDPGKNKENSIEGLSQYIDLASSMRYWQQLSLLYKNKLLASTPSISTLVVSSSTNTASVNSTSNTTTALTEAPTSNIVTPSDSLSSVGVTAGECIKEERPSSTPNSVASNESLDSSSNRSDIVIDNSNRLIEEHCRYMNEVISSASQDSNDNAQGNEKPPSLSFIPDTSIAYVNIGTTQEVNKAG